MEYLKVDKLSKRYIGTKNNAISDLSLSVSKGDIVYLIGESGSGKTTALRIIAGFETASSGCISINGKVIESKYKSIVPEKRGVGFIFQDPSLFPHLTVEKNIGFGLSRLGRFERAVRVREMLGMFLLNEYADRYPSQLSGGQQQRVAVARALALKPSLMLFDEAFSRLNYELKDQLMKELKEILCKERITAICVSHSITEAMNNADRIGVLRCGKLEQIDKNDEILKKPATVHVARALGYSNLFRGVAARGGIDSEIGFLSLQHNYPEGMTVQICVHPKYIYVEDLSDNGQQYGICSKVMSSIYHVDSKKLVVKVVSSGTIIHVKVENDFWVSEGQNIQLSLDYRKMHIFQA